MCKIEFSVKWPIFHSELKNCMLIAIENSMVSMKALAFSILFDELGESPAT